jgi:hypothetical protein
MHGATPLNANPRCDHVLNIYAAAYIDSVQNLSPVTEQNMTKRLTPFGGFRNFVPPLRQARMGAAAELVESGVQETLTYYAFPDIQRQMIRTNNPLERIMKEIRREQGLSAHFLTDDHA